MKVKFRFLDIDQEIDLGDPMEDEPIISEFMDEVNDILEREGENELEIEQLSPEDIKYVARNSRRIDIIESA